MQRPLFNLRWSFLVILLSLILSGCISDKLYNSVVDKKHRDNLDVENADFYFVEFRKNGDYWREESQQPKQFDKLYARLVELFGAGDVVIVVYVHGWKHNAAHGSERKPYKEDKDRQMFKQAVAGFARAETRMSGRHVVGVYLGWHGKSTAIKYVDNLTFWSRKRAAKKIGKAPKLDEQTVLRTLTELYNLKEEMGSGNSRLVVFSHSFGTLLLFEAIKKKLIPQIAKVQILSGKSETIPTIKGVADLVIMVNPAFEAAQFIRIRERLKDVTFPVEQRPILAIFTSERDLATKYAFPLGQLVWIPRWDELFEHRKKWLSTIGHYKPFQTHRLCLVEKTSRGICKQKKLEKRVKEPSLLKYRTLSEYRVGENWDPCQSIALKDPRFPKGKETRLLPNVDCAPGKRFPFVLVRVGKKVIGNHNDIWRPTFVGALANFVTCLDPAVQCSR